MEKQQNNLHQKRHRESNPISTFTYSLYVFFVLVTGLILMERDFALKVLKGDTVCIVKQKCMD